MPARACAFARERRRRRSASGSSRARASSARERRPGPAFDAHAPAERPRQLGADRVGEGEVHLLRQDRGDERLERIGEARDREAALAPDRAAEQRVVGEGPVEGRELVGGSQGALGERLGRAPSRRAPRERTGELDLEPRSRGGRSLPHLEQERPRADEQQPPVGRAVERVDRVMEAREARGRACERVGRRGAQLEARPLQVAVQPPVASHPGILLSRKLARACWTC
jgi:hypothetical protein